MKDNKTKKDMQNNCENTEQNCQCNMQCDSEENKGTSKKTKKAKKIIIIALASFVALFAVLYAVNFVLKKTAPKIGFTEKQSDIFYFSEDYSEDIFEDIVYANKFKDVKYDYFGEAVWINEQNYSQQTKTAKFFYDYFQTIINGQYTEYRDYFSKDFFNRHSIPQKFTKQKIYDIEVSVLDAEVVDNVVYETYKVGYKIYENNGSFRADVRSNDCKPVAIRVMLGSECKITSIIPIIDK